MRVLVTGGAGFIGSHVADSYLAQGHQVAIVDDLSSGRRENLNPSARFYEMDIGDPGIESVLAEERPQIVSHLAAQIDVRTSVSDPEADIRTNVVGLVRLAAACARNGVEVIVFSSTGGAIYGEPERNPVPETASVLPLSPYGIDKRAGELYLQYFQAVHGIQTRILRYANVYGPRQDPHGEAGVVAIFAGAMLAGRQPRIFGDGSQQRDFVYVGDIVRSALLAAENSCSEPINIGTGRLTSIDELYRAMAEVVGFDQPPVYEAARPGEVQSIALDPSLARDSLKWVPEIDLATGIRQTVDYFRDAESG
jgi:UDP-glucose 4-epimerase